MVEIIAIFLLGSVLCATVLFARHSIKLAAKIKSEIVATVKLAGGTNVKIEKSVTSMRDAFVYDVVFTDSSGKICQRTVAVPVGEWGRQQGSLLWDTPLEVKSTNEPIIGQIWAQPRQKPVVKSSKEQIISEQAAEIEHLRAQLNQQQANPSSRE